MVMDDELILPSQYRQQNLFVPKTGGMYDFPEAPSIRPWDDDEKDFLRGYRMGKALVYGVEGSGKGVLLAWLATRCKRFWPTRPLVSDVTFTQEFNDEFSDHFRTEEGTIISRGEVEKRSALIAMSISSEYYSEWRVRARPLITGKFLPAYTYIDQEIMLEQIQQTEALAKSGGANYTREEIEEWVVDGKAGGIVLRNCVLLLDEFDTWANRMRATSKVNEMTRGLQKRYRHYKMFMVGACPSEDDLDSRILNAMMYKIVCNPDDYRPDYFNYTWYTGHGIGSRGITKVAKVEELELYGRPLYKYFVSDAPVAVMSRNVPKKKKAKLVSDHEEA